MIRSMAGYAAHTRDAGQALRGVCRVGRRHALAAALALIVALLNPALCVLHCLILHGNHGAASTGAGAHADHAAMDHAAMGHADHAAMGHTQHAAIGQATDAGDDGLVASLCDPLGQVEQAGQPMPRAFYELAPSVALALILVLLPLHAPLGAALAPRPPPRLSPPTPPPRPFALA